MLGFFCFFEKHHQPPSTTWQTWLVTVFNFLIFFLSKIAAQLFFISRVKFLTTTISVTGFRRFSSLSTLVMYCWFFDLILFFCLFVCLLQPSSSHLASLQHLLEDFLVALNITAMEVGKWELGQRHKNWQNLSEILALASCVSICGVQLKDTF